MMKIFIESGCSVDKVNAEGQTCLHIAALNGDEMALRYSTVADNKCESRFWNKVCCRPSGQVVFQSRGFSQG